MTKLNSQETAPLNSVRVTAADYNPRLLESGECPFDGSPFTAAPAWLIRALEDRKIRATTHNGTDYAEWFVETPEGKKVASAGDWITIDDQGRLFVSSEHQ